jgi:hypothetical protein
MEDNMITLQDCIAFSELDTDTLRVVAAHFSLPDMIAAQCAGAQMQMPAGSAAIAIIQRQVSRPQ